MIQDGIFLTIASITLIGAFLAVSLKNVFYNALSLILCLFGVAGLFIFLNSEFLAVMEVIVYIGAISIAIIFAIMLSHPMVKQQEARNPKKVYRSLALAFLFFLALSRVIRFTEWPSAPVDGDYGLKVIGKSLLSTHILPFEAVSLVLLIAIIGALVLSEKKGSSS